MLEVVPELPQHLVAASSDFNGLVNNTRAIVREEVVSVHGMDQAAPLYQVIQVSSTQAPNFITARIGQQDFNYTTGKLPALLAQS